MSDENLSQYAGAALASLALPNVIYPILDRVSVKNRYFFLVFLSFIYAYEYFKRWKKKIIWVILN